MEESAPIPIQAVNEKLYIAVGKDTEECKSLLECALRYRNTIRKLCILHVHEPNPWIRIALGRIKRVSKATARDIKDVREREIQQMNKLLRDYCITCSSAGVVEVVHIENDSIEKGILELINQHGIRKLIMGAAADRHHSKKMVEPKSKKAIYVRQHAPTFCQIWFVCNGQLVCIREGTSEGVTTSPNFEIGHSRCGRSQSVPVLTKEEDDQFTTSPNFEIGDSRCGRSQSVPILTKEEDDQFSSPRIISVAEVMEELRIAKSSLESQIIANSERMVKDLEQKMFSAVELLQKYKKERDELRKERDNALEEAEELRREKVGAATNELPPEIFSEVSFSEILEATSNFDASLKIGEGGYGIIYKGFLRHTQVAIKTRNSNSMQGPSEFQQEVTVLSKLRHPNLVTLIGACPQFFILVYEYLPNGSLEDRLCCKDNSPPLSWQTRIRIATELCSALIFLHSSKPYGIVHRDLKPANILLDSNCVSKLSDFGICRVLGQNQFSSNNTTPCWITECHKGTLTYMDPEFLATGELTPKSDVYSFGIILLRLLTGMPALGIAKEVKYAVDKGNLENLLDPTAGGWPFVQARRLALVALRCCEMNRENRPDLALDVWRELKCMSVSCGTSPFFTNSVEDCQIPPYFICPIFQETMRDPHMAADGYTYELEAIKGWLNGGHDKSPMTNVKLPHCNLVPNHALRSTILEWRQQHKDE